MQIEAEFRLAWQAARRGRIDRARYLAACATWLDRPEATFQELLGPRGDPVDGHTNEPLSQDTDPWGGPVSTDAATSDPGPGPGPEGTTAPGPDGDDDATGDWSSSVPGALDPDDSPRHPAGPRYERRRLIATGGLGQIWLAYDRHLGREVALKELRYDRRHDPNVAARFLRESRINAQLGHPGIVPVYDLIEEPGEEQGVFYTMRFVAGRTLNEAVEAYHGKRGQGAGGELAIELRDLVGAFLAVCHAVAYAHARGVLHRDLKGQNVALGDFGEVQLLDWGLGKILGIDEETSEGPVRPDPGAGGDLTATGHALGTPAYMAPEQAAGGLVDRRSDVYGLGAILYLILAGRAPYVGGTSREIVLRVLQEPPPRPREVLPAVPPALEAVCLKAMAREPADRYGSAVELADEVRRWLADEPVDAYPEPWTARLRRWSRRHRPLVAAAAALLATATVALAVSNGLIRREQRRTEAARVAAETSFVLVSDALRRDLTDVRQGVLAALPGAETFRRDFARRLVYLYGELLKLRAHDPDVLADAARAYFSVGTVLRQTGEFGEAEGALGRAIALDERLSEERPDEPAPRDQLALALMELAVTRRLQGRLPECEPQLSRAEAIARDIRARWPDYAPGPRTEAQVLVMHAQLLRITGRVPESIDVARRSLAILDSLPPDPINGAYDALYRIFAASQLHQSLSRARRWDEAHEAGLRQLRLCEDYLPGAPENNDRRFLLAEAHAQLGRGLAAEKADPDEAARHFDRAVELVGPLTHEFAGLAHYRRALVEFQIDRGEFHGALGHAGPALADAEAARDALAPLLAREPRHPTSNELLGRALGLLGRVALDGGRADEARSLLKDAINRTELARQANPRSPELAQRLDRLRADLERASVGP